MSFKSDKQRKCVMALFNKGLSPRASKIVCEKPKLKTKTFQELKKKGIFLKYQSDTDKDGVINIKDCQPLNPKKQGFLHDLAVKRLRKKEEKLEATREKEQKKLEDLKDKLKERRKVIGKKADIKTLQLKQKQAIIEETKIESEKLRVIEQANIKAKQELEKGTIKGFIKERAKKTGKLLTSETTKKAVRNSVLALAQASGFLKKKTVKAIKKKYKNPYLTKK